MYIVNWLDLFESQFSHLEKSGVDEVLSKSHWNVKILVQDPVSKGQAAIWYSDLLTLQSSITTTHNPTTLPPHRDLGIGQADGMLHRKK